MMYLLGVSALDEHVRAGVLVLIDDEGAHVSLATHANPFVMATRN